jgi:tetratricopeptide (TPR) repeat protein
MAQRIRIIALVVFLVAPAPTPARSTGWPVPRGPSREPVPYRYDPGQWKQVPKEFLEDAPACVLYSGTSYLIEADGTVESTTHEITRLNGRKGIDKLGEYRNIVYDPAYQTVTLNEARVLKASGQSIPVEPRHVQVRDQSTDYLVYDHDKQVVISFPFLEVGDAIEVKWTTRGKNPEFQGHFATRYTFGDDSFPVVLDELRVRLPRTKALKFATRGGTVEPVVRDEGELRTYHWRATNRRQLPQDDNLPPKEELRLQLGCSTFASWDEVGKWKEQIRARYMECTPEIRKVVETVTRGLDTPEQKARALTYWVRAHIRYVALGAVRHDYTPHPPAQTLANRYGDCKDQSQLLAVMLHAAGVPVGLATLGTLEDGQVWPELPSPWGTHAILLVPLAGKDHWIDTTINYAPWDYLPRDDCDRLAYVSDEKGLRLVQTPRQVTEANRFEQTTHLRVGADGSSRSERTFTYHGTPAVLQRQEWIDAPAGERRRLMATELMDSNSRARLSRLQIEEARLRDLDAPVSARLVFEIPGQFSGDDDLEGSVTDSKIWGKLLSVTLDYDREAPLDLASPFESVHRYEITLPPALLFESLPADQSIRSGWGSFTLKVEADPANSRHVRIEFHSRLEKTRVEVADLDAFRRFHESLIKHYRGWLTLRATRDLADAPALEAVLALTPGDTATAKVLAQLYLHNGMKAEARRVLQRSRHYHADSRTLWDLTVKAAADLDEEEAAYQELLRRFPGEARNAVALGTTRVNRGDHARALEVLEPVAEKGPAGLRGAAHFQLARSAFRQRRFEEARRHLDAAAEIDPQSVAGVEALQLAGRVQEELGQPVKAAEAYRLAIKIDPEAEGILLSLIRLALADKDRATAVDYLRRYTLAVGDDAEGLAGAAELHLRLERYEDAFDLATRALQKKDAAAAHRTLGLVCLHRGERESAWRHLLKAEPDAEVLEALIRIALVRGELADAIAAAQRAQKLENRPARLRQAENGVVSLHGRRDELLREARVPPENAAAVRAAGFLACAEQARTGGRPPAEIQALLAGAFAGGVEFGPAYALRSLLQLERGNLRAAQADAERAIGLSPRLARGYHVRGRVRLERGAEGALEDMEKAAELSGRKDALILEALADALGQAGRTAEGERTRQEASKLLPQTAPDNGS